jgi:hypothetical protein
LVTVALLVLWGFSPLATQAMQRVASTNYININSNETWGYINTATGSNALSDSSTDFSSVRPDMNRLYSAAFLANNDPSGGTDIFYNALIPIMAPNDLSSSDNWT